MINYFELYESILRVIRDKKPDQNNEFINYLSSEDYIQTCLKNGVEQVLLVEAVFETTDNLIDDGLIKAIKAHSKDGKHFIFEGLTTAGHSYLSALEQPSFKNKAKNVLIDEGIPLTPQSVSKVITRLILG